MADTVEVVGCSHEERLFLYKTRTPIIQKLLTKLTPYMHDFDAFAVQGYSMALVAPILAHIMGKNLILIRKKSEERHSYHDVEGALEQRVVFVDDLIDSGDTFDRIVKGVEELKGTVVGYLMYEENHASYHVQEEYPHITFYG